MSNQTRKIAFTLITIGIFISIGLCQSLEDRFQQITDSVYLANQDAGGIIVHVESPNQNISQTYAVGFSDKATKEKLDKNQPVLIASNTKTYVAASILRLVETGKLHLDRPIKKLVRKRTRKLLKKDGYDLKRITLRHLLSHTSGIHDYVDDDYFEFVNQNPQYQWTRYEQIALTAKVGEPLAEPGTKFSYADINYLLLTEIIERKTGKPFYTSMKTLLKYDELGLQNTWFKNLEKTPAQSLPLAHQYSDKHNWDSHNLNPSWDLYGGGGLAATAKDLALFFQALFEGKIITDNNTLKEMYSYVLPAEESNYCLGIRNIPFENFRVYYHGGFWGTDAVYSPETNASVVVFTLQKDKRGEINPFLGKKITEILQQE